MYPISQGKLYQAAEAHLKGRRKPRSHPHNTPNAYYWICTNPMLRVTCHVLCLRQARHSSRRNYISAYREVDCREPGSTTLPNLAIQSSGNLAVHLVGGAFRTAAATLVEQVDCSKSVYCLHGWIDRARARNYVVHARGIPDS